MSTSCDRCHKEVETNISIMEGVICGECHKRLQAAKSEAKRICLKDGLEMDKDLVLNIIIDKCPSCGGVWLDGGEIDIIKENVRNFQKAKNWAKTGADILTGIVSGLA